MKTKRRRRLERIRNNRARRALSPGQLAAEAAARLAPSTMRSAKLYSFVATIDGAELAAESFDLVGEAARKIAARIQERQACTLLEVPGGVRVELVQTSEDPDMLEWARKVFGR